MRTIHKERKSRFFSLRPTYPYLSDFSTASWAARYSLLLVRKKPLARASVFLRLARRLVPRFTLGTFQSPWKVIQFGGSGTCGALSTGILAPIRTQERTALARDSRYKL